ncbi:MAG: GGDEF domain-containing protein [Pseudomonadales bacterium]|nr:GGDEF domain-containing protein [Pseudomonadales bacterium]
MNLLTLTINVSVSIILLYTLVSLRQNKIRNNKADARFDTMQLQLEDISRQNSRLQKENTTDSLTGIGNRAHFEITYKMEWDRAFREQKAIAMLMIDIDHFKRINDQFGHTEGDQCLVAVALAIRGCLHRASDRLMRFGGEEFAVLLSSTDIEGVRLMSSRILAAVKSLEFHQTFQLTVSIGGASLVPGKSKDSQCFIRLVDDALYRAKDAGRDCFELVENKTLLDMDIMQK